VLVSGSSATLHYSITIDYVAPFLLTLWRLLRLAEQNQMLRDLCSLSGYNAHAKFREKSIIRSKRHTHIQYRGFTGPLPLLQEAKLAENKKLVDLSILRAGVAQSYPDQTTGWRVRGTDPDRGKKFFFVLEQRFSNCGPRVLPFWSF